MTEFSGAHPSGPPCLPAHKAVTQEEKSSLEWGRIVIGLLAIMIMTAVGSVLQGASANAASHTPDFGDAPATLAMAHEPTTLETADLRLDAGEATPETAPIAERVKPGSKDVPTQQVDVVKTEPARETAPVQIAAAEPVPVEAGVGDTAAPTRPPAQPATQPTPAPAAPTPPPAQPATQPTPAPAAPTPPPAQPATQPAAPSFAPTVGRAGPASVVNSIPGSAFAWLDAYGWTVDWRQGPGPGRQSEAQYATNTIVIWYTADRSNAFWAGAFAHELGHAVSYVHFGATQMNDWNQMRGLSGWRWVPGSPNDFSVGEGDFAEAFMNYLIGHNVRSVGGPVTAHQRQWIAANTPF